MTWGPWGTANPTATADIDDRLTDIPAADIPFTPTGTIAASNVQDAIAEVASEAGGSGLSQSQVLARGLGA